MEVVYKLEGYYQQNKTRKRRPRSVLYDQKHFAGWWKYSQQKPDNPQSLPKVSECFLYFNKWKQFISTLSQFPMQQIACEFVPFLSKTDGMCEVIVQNKLKLNKKRKTVQRMRNQTGIHTRKKIATKHWKCKWLPRALCVSYEQIKSTD